MPVQKKSGNLLKAPRIYLFFYFVRVIDERSKIEEKFNSLKSLATFDSEGLLI